MAQPDEYPLQPPAGMSDTFRQLQEYQDTNPDVLRAFANILWEVLGQDEQHALAEAAAQEVGTDDPKLHSACLNRHLVVGYINELHPTAYWSQMEHQPKKASAFGGGASDPQPAV